MSLFGALNLGSSGLTAQQAALQITGNNIANSSTPGYTRESAVLTPTDPVSIDGQNMGTGVSVTNVERDASEALNENMRNANSDLASAQSANDYTTQVESAFGALNSGDLASQASAFFDGLNTLSNNPQDSGQRAIAIQNGVSLTSYITNLHSQISTIRSNAQTQVAQLAPQINTILQGIAQINDQVASAQTGGTSAGPLLDQRDTMLTNLAQIMDVHTSVQANGQVNVYTGSQPLVQGDNARTITTQSVTNSSGTGQNTVLVFADNGAQVQASSGQLAALSNVTQNTIDPALATLDTYAQTLINTVNNIHSQGQGLSNFSTVTGTAAVSDPTAALNSDSVSNGLSEIPVNGTFDFNVTDAATGQTSTQQIKVNLSGSGTPTSLNSLAASLTSSNIVASVDAGGHLTIKSTDPNTTFSFGNDTSNVLAALGVNTFFSGTNASSIGVNQTLVQNSDLLATGQNNVPGSNQNVQTMALGLTAASPAIGGQSLQDFYTNYIGNLATTAQSAASDLTAKTTVQTSTAAQVQSFSGVSLDQEAVNLTEYQRAFEGSAQFITVVNQMMQTVLGLVSTGTVA